MFLLVSKKKTSQELSADKRLGRRSNANKQPEKVLSGKIRPKIRAIIQAPYYITSE